MTIVNSPNNLRFLRLESYVFEITPACFLKLNLFVFDLFEDFNSYEVLSIIEDTSFAIYFVDALYPTLPITCARLDLGIECRQRDQ